MQYVQEPCEKGKEPHMYECVAMKVVTSGQKDEYIVNNTVIT